MTRKLRSTSSQATTPTPDRPTICVRVLLRGTSRVDSTWASEIRRSAFLRGVELRPPEALFKHRTR